MQSSFLKSYFCRTLLSFGLWILKLPTEEATESVRKKSFIFSKLVGSKALFATKSLNTYQWPIGKLLSVTASCTLREVF